MKYLIFELFSGVGFCNQLFSLETAIYLANISNRKLILIIRNPLCHCGSSSWDFGNIMEMLSSDYIQYLPQGIEVHYKMIPAKINALINNTNTTQHIKFGRKMSHIGIIDEDIFNKCDRNLANDGIVKFLHGRAPYLMNVNSWNKEYAYINESNASRCFYNFLTSEKNYATMSNICEALTKLKPEFYTLFGMLNIPKQFMSFHFRFGDLRHSKGHIDQAAQGKFQNVERIIKSNASKDHVLVVMSDRKDADILKQLRNTHTIIFTEDIVDKIPVNELRKLFPSVKDVRVIQFLLQKYVCEQSSTFVGYECSTVSNHIHYTNYLNNKPSHLYVEKETNTEYENHYSWVNNGVFGASIAFKRFFRDNIKVNISKSNTKLITLTNDGYLEMTENLLLSMKKIGIEQTLKIYCIGSVCYDYLREKFPHNEIERIDVDNPRLNSWVEYRSVQNSDIEGKNLWADITSYKLLAINNELVTGNDVIFTDGDIVFDKNPFPHIFENIKDGLELLIQNDEQTGQTPKMCTGFFWMRSNENTIKITDFKAIRENIHQFTNDQQYMRRFAGKINHKYFDLDLFPNGKHYREKRPSCPYIVHFNYDVSNHKIRRMKQFKKWYINERDLINPVDENIDYIDKHPITKYLKGRGVQLKQGSVCNVKELETFIIENLQKSKMKFNQILEVGFLAGHSANLFLKNFEGSHVTSIDHGKLQSVNQGKEYIDTIYPRRHILLKGNSIDKLKDLGDTRFDLILIDGGFDYETVLEDVRLCHNLIKDDTIVLMNNVVHNALMTKYWNKGPTDVWNTLIKENRIEPISQKDFGTGVGIAMGKNLKLSI